MISPKFNKNQTTKTSMQGEMVKGITVLKYKVPWFRKVNEQKKKKKKKKKNKKKNLKKEKTTFVLTFM